MKPVSGSIIYSKPDLRRRIRDAIVSVDRATESRMIVERLQTVLPATGYILAFEPLADEPDISAIIEMLRRAGRLALIAGDRSAPTIEPPEATIEFALVPGRAFDRRGARLGRGGGTFDRVLGRLECPKIGVAYDCQLLENLPVEPHDQLLDRVITCSHDIRVR